MELNSIQENPRTQIFIYVNAWAADKVMGCFQISFFFCTLLWTFTSCQRGFYSTRRSSPGHAMGAVCFLKTIKNDALMCELHLQREVLRSERTWENSHGKLTFTITDRSNQTTGSSCRNSRALLKRWERDWLVGITYLLFLYFMMTVNQPFLK